jgi:hypothetical protein
MRNLWCNPSPSNDDAPVTCSFIADTAGKNVSYSVSWGDGTSERVPATGTVAPSTTTRATHVWPARGEYTVTVTATDTSVPPLTSSARTFTQSVSCVFERSNTLLFGLGGVEVDNMSARWERGVPSLCWGEDYILDASVPNEFDLCWYGAGALIECSRATGDERGVVPAGADAARIIYRTGATGAYFLRVL